MEIISYRVFEKSNLLELWGLEVMATKRKSTWVGYILLVRVITNYIGEFNNHANGVFRNKYAAIVALVQSEAVCVIWLQAGGFLIHKCQKL